ncbi:RHS repeat domain-containing protein [Limisphaera sp. 4302-co]|uniref:RHS repeat domain-containing protein n=1 Tax=Limisphaera sp. 4302-co TaxID=3400417 RepID=UPI003C14DAD3
MAGPSSSFRRVDWKYDARGRRTRQTSYVYTSGVWQVVEDLKLVSDPLPFGRHIAELNATNNAPVRAYVWGLDLSETLEGAGGVGGLLWVRMNTGPATGTHFVCYDGNGNVWNLVSASTGSETARYEYGPFGEPLRLSCPAARYNPLRFGTKRTEDFSGLVLYEYRAYSPTLGRWLSRDPLDEAGGSNLSAFVFNAATSRVDVKGLWIPGPDGRWHPPSRPRANENRLTSIELCNRKIENACNDFIIGCANLRGHDLYRWPDGRGGWESVGFLDANAKDGALPEPDKPERARYCCKCYGTSERLQHGPGKGKKGLDATEEEITQCLKNRPIKGDYDGLFNNCNRRAVGAGKECGPDCGYEWRRVKADRLIPGGYE